MTAKELITELSKLDSSDLDKEVKIYSLVDMKNIDIDLNEFELIGDKIEIGISYNTENVLIEGYFS